MQPGITDWRSIFIAPVEPLPYHQSFSGGNPQLQLEERNHCPQSQEDTGERAGFKPAPRRDLVPPPPPEKKKEEKKPPIFLSHCVCFSLTLLSLSFPLSLSLPLPLSLAFRRLPPPQTWISRRGVCFFYHVSAWYWRSIWRRLIRATMWSPVPHQRRSTTRIPVKLVRFRAPLCLVLYVFGEIFPHFGGGRNMPLAQIEQENAFSGDDSSGCSL